MFQPNSNIAPSADGMQNIPTFLLISYKELILIFCSVVHAGLQSIAEKVPPPINKVEDGEDKGKDESGNDVYPFSTRRKLCKQSHGAAADEA